MKITIGINEIEGNLQGTGVLYLSGSVAMSRLLSSFLPTPGGPIRTTGR